MNKINSGLDLMECRLCGERISRNHFECRGIKLLRCPSCLYVQIVKKPSPQELDDIYSERYFSSSKYGDAMILDRENARRSRLVEKFGPLGGKVLDAGCATGDFLHSIGDRYKVRGWDISAYAVDKARVRNPNMASRIHVVDMENDSLPTGLFDAICLWDVIEHFWNPVAICRQLAARLRPDGHLFISTPDIGSWTARLMRTRWAFMTPPEHMGFFSKHSFAWLFGKILPFRIVYRCVSGKWTNLGFFVYKLKRVFPVLFSGRSVVSLQNSPMARLPLYIPTQDIQYIVAQKGAWK